MGKGKADQVGPSSHRQEVALIAWTGRPAFPAPALTAANRTIRLMRHGDGVPRNRPWRL